MVRDWNIINNKIFGILKGSGFRLEMYDKSGKRTMEQKDATRFVATIKSNNPKLETFTILVAIHDEDAASHVDIKTPIVSDDVDFNKIYKIKQSLQTNIGDHEGLKINWDQFNHPIRAKDAAIFNVKETVMLDDVIIDISESKDISKVYGTTKSSYQKIGESKIIIRHTDSVDETKQGSRWRKIKNIFIENKIGERFNYPYPHIAGARAMARHLTNEGMFNDSLGQTILKMSDDYIELKRANKFLRKTGDDRLSYIKEAISVINKLSKTMCGSRGYKNNQNSLLNEVNDIDIEAINELKLSLAEMCGVLDQDQEKLKTFETAARYIINVSKNYPVNEIDQTLEEIVIDDDLDIKRLEELAGLSANKE